MKTKPLISVIIPIYNVEAYLEKCVKSVLSQDYGNLEVILVDDGSPDGCPALCDSFAAADSRVKVVHKANAGLGLARNSGMEVATGEYITFVDSDDWWEPNALTPIVDKILAEDADTVMFGFRTQQPDGSFTDNVYVSEPMVYTSPEIKTELAASIVHQRVGSPVRKVFMSAWTTLLRRDKAVEFLSEREVASEDMPFKASVILNSDRFLVVPDILVNWRYSSNGLSKTYSFEKFKRYKNLTAVMRNIFASTTMPTAGDYCMVYASASAMMGMYCSDTPRKVRRQYINQMAGDNIWSHLNIDKTQLTRKERVMHSMISGGHGFVAWVVAEIFYGAKLRSAKRHHFSQAKQ